MLFWEKADWRQAPKLIVNWFHVEWGGGTVLGKNN